MSQPDASVGEIPEEAERGPTSINELGGEREQHLVIRRKRLPTPDEEDLDDGPDVDPDTGALRPSVYRQRGMIVRDN